MTTCPTSSEAIVNTMMKIVILFPLKTRFNKEQLPQREKVRAQKKHV